MQTAGDFVPLHANLAELRAASAGCKGCPLFEHATQTVFGEGPDNARIIFIGEQPGDLEDIQGHPFVGPAGKLLNQALEEAGIDRRLTYVTNAVKHFKFEQRGKRRIHQKPNAAEVGACRPWIEAELEAIKPDVAGCLGATAAQAMLGPKFRVTRDRGVFFPHTAVPQMMATIHPSALLRMTEPERCAEEYELFVRDLEKLKDMVAR